MDIKMLSELIEHYGENQDTLKEEKYKELFNEIMFEWETISDIDFERLSEEALIYMLDNFLALSCEVSDDGMNKVNKEFERLLVAIRSAVSPRRSWLL